MKKSVGSIEELVAWVKSLEVSYGEQQDKSLILFRGQSKDRPLLPSVTRKDANVNTEKLERWLLGEFRRRLAREPDIAGMDDWDLLIYAQHFGLPTRLLDWSSNPLFALWFACRKSESKDDGQIYALCVTDKWILNTSSESNQCPFDISRTAVLKPNVNNSRVRAQSGWFTAHTYSSFAGRFVDLRDNTSITKKTDDGHPGRVVQISVPNARKPDLLKFLDRFGVNEETVYPGPEGTANYLKWLKQKELTAPPLGGVQLKVKPSVRAAKKVRSSTVPKVKVR